MELSFESCAVRFLDQWVLQEQPFFEGLKWGSNEDRLKAVQGAASYFGIARNFFTKYETCDTGRKLQRLEPVIEALEHAKDPTGDSEGAVEALEESLSIRYGNRRFMSAASKLLWLIHRDGIIIYDRKARESLGLKNEDYRAYCDEWRKVFSENEPSIRNACKALAGARGFALCGRGIDDNELKQVASEQWFRERVLDTYLWYQAD